MTAPVISSLAHGLGAALAEASSALPSLTPLAPEAINAAPDESFSALRHELSPHYRALHPLGAPAGRSQLEAGVLGNFESGADTLCLLSPRVFRDRLGALNLALTGGRGGWRDGTVRLGDDREGNRIFFPHVSAVPGQLERLRLLLVGQTGAPPLFTAGVAYALFLNCHPFTDGNGRTARVLFNHLLHRDGMPRQVYLPLHEIARRSHGGYEIALRMAEVRGEWEPFLRFILNGIQCHREVACAAIQGSARG